MSNAKITYWDRNPYFIINVYSGGTYCGNAFFQTFEECVEWFKEDEFVDEAIIKDSDGLQTVKYIKGENNEIIEQ